MADIVNVGTAPNSGDGDTNRDAFTRINQRFQELLGTLSQITWAPGLAIQATPARQWTVVAGQAYVAATNHTAGATFAADLSAGRWLAVDVVQHRADLSALGGAASVGTAAGDTVQEELDATRPLQAAVPLIDTTDAPASIAANPMVQRLLPAGTFTVTSYRPWNLYGPGELRFAGVDLPVPPSPQRGSLLRAGLGAVQASRTAGLANWVTLIGDSIGAGYHITTIDQSWFSLFVEYLRAGEVGTNKTLDVVSLFNEPTRWGLTLAGTTTVGTEGPVQASLRMTPGSTITYTGAFQFHEVFFERAAGAGSLEFRYNGTLYKTISCAGATASDVFTFPSAQSSGASGTHEIRCVGANVTVTGLWRAVQVATPSEPFFLRAARPGWGTVNFTDATIDSICRQSAPTGSDSGVFFIALGANDMVNGPVSQTASGYAANLDRIIQRIIRNQPKAAIYFIPSTRLNFTLYPIVAPNTTYYDFRAAAWEVCQSYNVPILDIDTLMLLERGLLSDGVHPEPPGHKLIAQFLVEQLQQRPPQAARKEKIRVGSFLADSAPTFTSGSGLIGAFTGGQGYLYAQNTETGAPLPLNIAHDGGSVVIGNGSGTTLTLNTTGRSAAAAGGFGATPATARVYVDVTVNGVDGCIPVYLRA